MRTLLVTGGAGFIGSNYIRTILTERDDIEIINVDKLTYAGNLENLTEIESKKNYTFIKGDITNNELIEYIFTKYKIDEVVNFAAESHVDRSILGSEVFYRTNVMGTNVLLEASRIHEVKKYLQISTDEVYGSLGETGLFTESTPLSPNSPYSSSKAGADMMAMAFYHTYDMPIVITRCSNNYGSYQFPEKLIPLMISNMIEGKNLPIYGDGKNIRDWLYVKDHCSGIWNIVLNGKAGETYNIGGENEWTNIDLVNNLCETVALNTEKEKDYYKKLITFVKDRKGHDKRYAINCDKIKSELDWKQSVTFEEGLNLTVKWYLNNKKWIENIKTGEYQK